MRFSFVMMAVVVVVWTIRCANTHIHSIFSIRGCSINICVSILFFISLSLWIDYYYCCFSLLCQEKITIVFFLLVYNSWRYMQSEYCFNSFHVSPYSKQFYQYSIQAHAYSFKHTSDKIYESFPTTTNSC